jgi:uncharacterized protein
MAQSAKVQEPSMEEILASIRRIIADDETKSRIAEPAKPAAAAPPPRPAAPSTPAPAPPPVPQFASAPQAPAATMNQDDIDSMLSSLDAPLPAKSNGKMEEGDVLDLTESMAASATAQPPVFRTIEGHSDVFFSEEVVEQAPESVPLRSADEARHPAEPAPEVSLLSSSTSAAVDQAFNTLAQTVLVQNARTLEDLVKEMMRPMLKAWLDDNLPGLVERVVRAEIERVSRGRP